MRLRSRAELEWQAFAGRLEILRGRLRRARQVGETWLREVARAAKSQGSRVPPFAGPALAGVVLVAILAGAITANRLVLSGAGQASALRARTVAAVATATVAPTPVAPPDLTQYVDPFVGTQWTNRSYGFGGGGGNTYPGATLPFGMVQWSPDTGPTPSWALDPGGYTYSDPDIQYFSLTHLSGAGCNVFGDLPFMPTTRAVVDDPSNDVGRYSATFSHAAESASPGYYSVTLGTGVHVELTATLRSGLARITYPAGQPRTLLVEPGQDLRGVFGAHAQVVSPTEVVGSATSGHFCNYLAGTYTVYFAAELSQPASGFGGWQGGRLMPGARSAGSSGSGVYLQFPQQSDPSLMVKVGLSYVSTDNALANLAAENPSWDFDAVRAAAHDTWNQALSHTQVSGGTTQDERIFYTALYHTMLDPNTFSDANGQYIGFDGHVHVAQSYVQYANFSGWDVYRSEIPLLALLEPAKTSDMMQSLVADAEQGGGLPRWPLANIDGGVMVGDPAADILADGYAWGATAFDARSALRLMIAGATQPGIGPVGSVERPGLDNYLALGYVPVGGGAYASASASLEYYVEDYAIGRLALALHDSSDAQIFKARAANWTRLFNPATGYIQPRFFDGSFPGLDPAAMYEFVEGNASQYTWMVPFDVGSLVDHMGGDARAQQRLDAFFTDLNAGPNAPHAWMSNEPSFGAPWEYDFMGAPWKTQAIARQVMTSLFQDRPDGLPGNDDLGTMSAWYVWAALGMYPLIPGRAGFVLGSPLFPSATLAVGSHNIRITAAGAGRANSYVQSLRVGGALFSSLWLPVEMLAPGSQLQFTLGPAPNMQWGSAPEDAPPSLPTDDWSLPQRGASA